MFIKFGDIVSAVIMKDENNQSKGFGFVCFKQAESARNALSLNDGDGLYVSEAKSKQQRQEELTRQKFTMKKSVYLQNLFVKGIHVSVTNEELHLYFSQFGQVNSIRVVPMSGIAYISFTTREAAKLAKDSGASGLRGHRLEIDYCQIKELRQA